MNWNYVAAEFDEWDWGRYDLGPALRAIGGTSERRVYDECVLRDTTIRFETTAACTRATEMYRLGRTDLSESGGRFKSYGRDGPGPRCEAQRIEHRRVYDKAFFDAMEKSGLSINPVVRSVLTVCMQQASDPKRLGPFSHVRKCLRGELKLAVIEDGTEVAVHDSDNLFDILAGGRGSQMLQFDSATGIATATSTIRFRVNHDQFPDSKEQGSQAFIDDVDPSHFVKTPELSGDVFRERAEKMSPFKQAEIPHEPIREGGRTLADTARKMQKTVENICDQLLGPKFPDVVCLPHFLQEIGKIIGEDLTKLLNITLRISVLNWSAETAFCDEPVELFFEAVEALLDKALSLRWVHDKFTATCLDHYEKSREAVRAAKEAACVLPDYRGPPLPESAAPSTDGPAGAKLIFREPVEIDGGVGEGELYLLYFETKISKDAPYENRLQRRLVDLFGIPNPKPIPRHRLLFHRVDDRGECSSPSTWLEVVPDHLGFRCSSLDSSDRPYFTWTFTTPTDAFSRMKDGERYTREEVRTFAAAFEEQKDRMQPRTSTEIRFFPEKSSNDDSGTSVSAGGGGRAAYRKWKACQHFVDGLDFEPDSYITDASHLIADWIDNAHVRAGKVVYEEYRKREDVIFFDPFFRRATAGFIRNRGYRAESEKEILRDICNKVEFVPDGSQDVCKRTDHLLDLLREGRGDWDWKMAEGGGLEVQMRFYCCVPPEVLLNNENVV